MFSEATGAMYPWRLTGGRAFEGREAHGRHGADIDAPTGEAA